MAWASAYPRSYESETLSSSWTMIHWDSSHITAVRLKVEENQLVGVFGEIRICIDSLKSV